MQEVQTSPYALYNPPKPEVFMRDPPMAKETKIAERGAVARDIMLRRGDFEQFGYTDSCTRCQQAIEKGWSETGISGPHSNACRVRMKEAIANHSEAGKLRVAAGERRANQWIAKRIQIASEGRD